MSKYLDRKVLIIIGIWLLFMAGVAIYLYVKGDEVDMEVNYSEAIEMVGQNKVESVSIDENEIRGQDTNGKSFKTRIPDNADFIKLLTERDVVISVEKKSNNIFAWAIVIFIGIIIFGFCGYFSSKHIAQHLAKARSENPQEKFGKSKARLLEDKDKRVTFEDVGGAKEEKEELKELIGFLKDPERYKRLGGRKPKGVLLVGPPGTGKTLLAKAVAGEAGVPFFSISGSDFVEMFVGVGAARIRDLFEQGEKNAPCILFVDEIDAVGRQRGTGLGGGHDEREQTLAELLVQMDGIEENLDIIIMAATNRPDVLDPALLRPGRFDRRLVVDSPDIVGREEIFRIHTRDKPLGPYVEISKFVQSIPGFTGADIDNLANEAALKATREGKDFIELEDLREAKMRVLSGPQRLHLKISKEEEEISAAHELGHAVTCALLKHADSLDAVTIIPRGPSLGSTWYRPKDRRLRTEEYVTAKLKCMLGGRAAEEIFFQTKTDGARGDIKNATDLATDMVVSWGMCPEIGLISLDRNDENPFLGRQITTSSGVGPKMQDLADEKIRELSQKAYEGAKELLVKNKVAVEILLDMLLDKRIISGEEVVRVLQEKGVDKPNSVE